MTGGSQAAYAELEFTPLDAEFHVPYRSRFMCSTM